MGKNKKKYSIFTWDFWKYKMKIAHSEKFPPELEIQYGFSKFAGFSREWYIFQEIPHLTFPLPPYSQTSIQ